MSKYDLVITNGLVVDGSGAKPRVVDVAISNGLIAAVGKGLRADAARTIDATGKLVTPGFVDVHTHYDGQATWDSHLNPSSGLGTTTVVMGNCGVGFAPCRPTDHETLVKLMEGVEEIPGTALVEGLRWNWVTFADYLDALDERERDIDVAALVPHAPLRVFVMGQRGVDREPATAADIAEMQRLLKDALAAGGVGFSTSRTLAHKTSDGDQIPTYKASTEELKRLGEVLNGEHGHVFQLISDWEDPEGDFDVLRQTSAHTGAKGTFTLLDLGTMTKEGQPLLREHLRRIEESQLAGIDIRGQVLSRPVGMLMGLPASMHSFAFRPSYRALADLPAEDRLRALRSDDVKQRVLGEQSVNPHVFVSFFEKRFASMYPLAHPIEYMPAREDSVAARAAREGRDAESWLYDYFVEGDGTNLVYIPAANFSAHIPELLRHPHTVPALGDGGAHVGSICDTSANLYVLTKWVKEKQALTLEEAIHMLTRKAAELYSLFDRGLLMEGHIADVNIIDFDQLRLHTPHIVHDLPAGGKRFLQAADGLCATIKSGAVIFENGEATGALPGKLLRGARQAPRSEASVA